jgi:hypothetical protein
MLRGYDSLGKVESATPSPIADCYIVPEELASSIKTDEEPSGFRLQNIDSRNAKILDIEEIPTRNLFNSNFPGAALDRWLLAFGGLKVTP